MLYTKATPTESSLYTTKEVESYTQQQHNSNVTNTDEHRRVRSRPGQPILSLWAHVENTFTSIKRCKSDVWTNSRVYTLLAIHTNPVLGSHLIDRFRFPYKIYFIRIRGFVTAWIATHRISQSIPIPLLSKLSATMILRLLLCCL